MSEKIKPLKNEKWARVKFAKATNNYVYEISNHGRIKSIDKKIK